MTDEELTSHMCYIGRASCGCVLAATVDNPDHAREVRRDVARFMRQAMTIERVTVEYVREHLGHIPACQHYIKPEDRTHRLVPHPGGGFRLEKNIQPQQAIEI